jgi:hypothetical protein
LQKSQQAARFVRAVELGKKLLTRLCKQAESGISADIPEEIEELGLWNDLEEAPGCVCDRSGVIYATNSQALQLLEREAGNTEGLQVA